ncbi:MAG: peptide-methionine (S)-S-oxide reductase MsrA [Gammaproteobacteria bacterium AqS3]|nr:peptide-methionine (S)-S-oxide reductase MsrA [Gammaproteobacteria bacterium AqS3]
MGFFGLGRDKSRMPQPEETLSGRSDAMRVPEAHAALGVPMQPPWPEGTETAVLGLGCFWGAERLFWQLDGVHSTAVGYAGGATPNPKYEEVCSGLTGHTEVVLVVHDPERLSFAQLLRVFWQAHDPTQGMRQGNDVGTQYRSAIYFQDAAQQRIAEESRAAYQQQLMIAGYGAITTDIEAAGEFYYAEAYHQQYLHKNPGGYCGIGGTGVTCPALGEAAA